MILISLLVVLFLEYQFKFSQQLTQKLGSDRLLPAWYGLLSARLYTVTPAILYSVIVLLPVLLIVWLTSIEGDFLHHIIQFALIIIVLSYCLGPIDQNEHLKSYFSAVAREDVQAAFIVVQENLNQKTCTEAPESMDALGRQVTELILRQCNFRMFGVLFYFVLLGIGGALAYTLICQLENLVREDEDSRINTVADKVLTWVDWLPQRLTALLYSLAGDFNGAFAQFLPYAFKSGTESRGMLEATGIGAMGLDTDNRQLDIITENKQALALVSRSMKVLILIIAIMTVFGWLA